jgi:hypothetical protein
MAILIQRNWRKYHYDKVYNLSYTKNYFNKTPPHGEILAETK